MLMGNALRDALDVKN